MSPYNSGLQQLLRVCANYGLQHDIKFNVKKSGVMIARTKEDRKLCLPSFYLSGQGLTVVAKAKDLGHIIRDDFCDEDDIQRQCCKWYGRKFHMCNGKVKTSLLIAYCTPLYTAHLWCSYSEAKTHQIQVAYKDALRILLSVQDGPVLAICGWRIMFPPSMLCWGILCTDLCAD